MSKSECKTFISAGEHFLASSARVAVISYILKENRFPVTPKHHMLYHVIKNAAWQFDIAQTALNPIVESCAMDEDYVGRIARVARSVSPRTPCIRTLQRYLLQAADVWFS